MKITNITVDNMNFAVYFELDDDPTPPWKRCDAHGPVSGYTNSNKAPGEMILYDNKGYRLYYNYQEACRIALKDEWNYEGSTGTKLEIASKSAMRDYEYLRQWCNNQWHYVGVIVELLDYDGDETGIRESLFVIEDTCNCLEVAKQLASEIILSCQRMNS